MPTAALGIRVPPVAPAVTRDWQGRRPVAARREPGVAAVEQAPKGKAASGEPPGPAARAPPTPESRVRPGSVVLAARALAAARPAVAAAVAAASTAASVVAEVPTPEPARFPAEEGEGAARRSCRSGAAPRFPIPWSQPRSRSPLPRP